jgi:diketogulonate reductase-like aldo/keto reductase
MSGNTPRSAYRSRRTPIEFRGDVPIPRLDLGVFRAAAGGETRMAVQAALGADYRPVDTARIYGNRSRRRGGSARQRPGRRPGPRHHGLPNDDHGYRQTLDAFDAVGAVSG